VPITLKGLRAWRSARYRRGCRSYSTRSKFSWWWGPITSHLCDGSYRNLYPGRVDGWTESGPTHELLLQLILAVDAGVLWSTLWSCLDPDDPVSPILWLKMKSENVGIVCNHSSEMQEAMLNISLQISSKDGYWLCGFMKILTRTLKKLPVKMLCCTWKNWLWSCCWFHNFLIRCTAWSVFLTKGQLCN